MILCSTYSAENGNEHMTIACRFCTNSPILSLRSVAKSSCGISTPLNTIHLNCGVLRKENRRHCSTFCCNQRSTANHCRMKISVRKWTHSCSRFTTVATKVYHRKKKMKITNNLHAFSRDTTQRPWVLLLHCTRFPVTRTFKINYLTKFVRFLVTIRMGLFLTANCTSSSILRQLSRRHCDCILQCNALADKLMSIFIWVRYEAFIKNARKM